MPPLPTSAAAGSTTYPEREPRPVSDDPRRFLWLLSLRSNLARLFRDRPDVLVSGNHDWYPVKGRPEFRAAPDVYVVLGRPGGHRECYKQWEEDGVPLTVVFEILSPNNTGIEMADKLAFYDEHGVEEYHLYDPLANRLHGYARHGEVLVRVHRIDGFVSPRLGIRFDLSGPELVVRHPDGRPFLTFEELEAQRAATEHRFARLAELSRKALAQQATPDELQELQQLLGTPPAP